MTTIDIAPDDYKTICTILKLRGWLPKTYAFGSRVLGTAKQYSDLDLVVRLSSPLPNKQLQDIQSTLAETSIPFLVDIVDWHQLSPAFQAAIESQLVAFA